MTKSFYFLKEDTAAGQGLKVDEEEERYKQGGQGTKKDPQPDQKATTETKCFF
jgi:hypothetical protein